MAQERSILANVEWKEYEEEEEAQNSFDIRAIWL